MCTQPVECLPGCPGVLCASWEVFFSTDVLKGAHWRPGARVFLSIASSGLLMGSVLLMKFFRDFRRDTTPRCPLSGCLSSVVCRVRSVRLATALLMCDGAIPASTGRLLVFVGFRHPVIILQFHSVSRPVSLHGWSVPTPGKHTLQLSSIALEWTT